MDREGDEIALGGDFVIRALDIDGWHMGVD
jgi:hypothetical protein